MKIKNIIWWSIALVTLIAACKKDEEVQPAGPIKNIQRVKTISGHNTRWGDFRMECIYTKEKLDSAVIWDKNEVRRAFIRVGYGKIISFSVYEMVPKVPPGEEEKMNPLEVPRVSRLLFSKNITFNSYDQIVEIKEVYYGLVESKGGKYTYQFEEKRMDRNLYEYNAENKVVCRRMSEPLQKEMFFYQDGLLTETINYVYGQEDWQLEDRESYEYENGRLRNMKKTGVGGKSLSAEYVWEGGCIRSVHYSVGEEDQEISYQYDKQGYMTRKDEGNGNWMEISYEAGNGNFTLFNSYLELLKGLPYIR